MTRLTEEHLAEHRRARRAQLDEQQAATAEAMTEARFQSVVRQFCDHLGLRVYHTYRSDRSDKGYPDLHIVGATSLFRELKTEIGRVDLEQAGWIRALRAAGHDANVWRPTDLMSGRIERELTAIRRRM